MPLIAETTLKMLSKDEKNDGKIRVKLRELERAQAQLDWRNVSAGQRCASAQYGTTGPSVWAPDIQHKQTVFKNIYITLGVEGASVTQMEPCQ